MKDQFQMQCHLALVSEHIDNTEGKCLEYRESFLQHSFLWTESVTEAFDAFISDGAVDMVKYEDEDGNTFSEIMQLVGVSLGGKIPPMDKFDKEIIRLNSLKKDISDMKAPIDIHWLRVNAFPVKMSLVQYASKWESQYTNFLKERTEAMIESSTQFIARV
jgi:hypothetical protein